MALVKRQTNSTRLIIIVVVVAVVGVIGYVLSQQLFSGPSSTNVNGPTSGRTVTTNFGETILNDSRYTDLQTYGVNLNVDVNAESGQPQPFQ